MIIYKTTNLINGKIYIGQDSKNNPKYLGSGVIIIKAIKKYGKENFIKETIEHCETKENLDLKEIYWINYYNSVNPNGYNISIGGGGCLGCKISDKTKEKLSDVNKGKILSDETKQKISEANKGKIFTKTHKDKISKNHADVNGKNNPMYGKTHSDEIKEKLKNINLGKKASKKTKEKMSEQRKGEGNSKSKLTEQQVLMIRDLYFIDGESQRNLAIKFQVQDACIFKIVTYRTWKHI